MTIVPYLNGKVFEPQHVRAMSTALEDVCKILDVPDEAQSEREQLARKIIVFALQGEPDAALLRDRVLRNVADGQDGWAAVLVRAARRGAL